MVGRNEPCPCSSGKKYKRCCSKKNELTVSTLVDEELQRILDGYYDYLIGPSEIKVCENYIKQWQRTLGNLWNEKMIGEAVVEHYMFIIRRDAWRRYLLKHQNSDAREAVCTVLESWKNPFLLFGRIKGEQDGFVIVEEILGTRTIYLEKQEGITADKNSLIFGLVFPDTRNHARGVHIVTSLLVVNDFAGNYEKSVIAYATSSGIEDSYSFYVNHALDVYQILLSKVTDEKAEQEYLLSKYLQPLQLDALKILEAHLDKMEGSSEVASYLKNLMIAYFLKVKPSFRKPDIIAAAAFRVAYERGFLAGLFTQSEIAKQFNVSVTSMTKHVDNMFVLLEEIEGKNGQKVEKVPAIS